jgi:hypothetical protein
MARANDGPDAHAPTDWLLDFTSANWHASDGNGRPWGDGSAIAERPLHGLPPWDEGCEVTPLVGGFETMNAIRDTLERAIDDAGAQRDRGVLPGQRGHVYLADWQPWRVAADPWTAETEPAPRPIPRLIL